MSTVQISRVVGGRSVARWIDASVGTAAAVTFSEEDQLGEELLERWQRFTNPVAAQAADEWNILAALAWIATSDLAVASRAMHRFRDVPEGSRYHELACLRWDVHRSYCRCPGASGWQDCRCVHAAFDKLIDAMKKGWIHGRGGFLGHLVSRSVWHGDILGLGNLPGSQDRLVVRFTNGLQWVRFGKALICSVFPRNPRQVRDSEVGAWIRNCGISNSRIAWSRFHREEQFASVSHASFQASWRVAFPNKKRGRPRKVIDAV